MKTTPACITALADNEIFVFGSNLAGRHGAGAALTAWRCFGAIPGKGSGIQGRSYAIPTKNRSLRRLTPGEIAPFVNRFLRFATSHPEKEFLVTAVGCGLAGWGPEDIAPLFANPPANIALPAAWWAVLRRLPRCEGYRRHGGAFTLGPVRWAQCINSATMRLRIQQPSGSTVELPACPVCLQECRENKLTILDILPVL